MFSSLTVRAGQNGPSVDPLKLEVAHTLVIAYSHACVTNPTVALCVYCEDHIRVELRGIRPTIGSTTVTAHYSLNLVKLRV